MGPAPGGAEAATEAPATTSVDHRPGEKVKDTLWGSRGGGGNTAGFATAEGLTVVDTKSPGWGQPLLDKIKTISNKPITTVITPFRTLATV